MSTLDRTVPGIQSRGTTRAFAPLVDGFRPVLAVALLTFVLRLPYLRFPITSDEGGYLLIARSWSSGHASYGAYFLDRPPLLVVYYQLVTLLSHLTGDLGAVRIIGSLAAAATVVGVGLAARRLAGSTASRWAALVTGALMVSPFVGSVATDGELLAAPFIAFGIWLAILATGERDQAASTRAAIAAGVCAAAAVLVKQNMLDVLVFSGVLALATWQTGRLVFADVRRLATGLLAGAGATLLVVAGYAWLHGTSPADIWFSMYGFRAQAAEVFLNYRPADKATRLTTLCFQELVSGGLLLAAVPAVLWRRRRTSSSLVRPVVVALVVLTLYVTVSVLAGGSFWVHYLVQYTVPTGLAAGLLVASRVRFGRDLAQACLAVALLTWLSSTLYPDHSAASEIGTAISKVAAPGDTMVSALGDPVITQRAGMDSPYPYLWSLTARPEDPHFTQLRDVLAGPDAPTWVVVRGPETLATLRGEAPGSVLASSYHQVAQMCDRIVFVRDDVTRATPVEPTLCSSGDGGILNRMRLPQEVR